MSAASNVSNAFFEVPDNDSMVENAPAFIERRNVLKIVGGSAVFIAAEFSGVFGALNDSIRLDQISDIQQVVDQAYGLKEIESQQFDVRQSYGLVRFVFGGTIGRTADYYGVSRKTIYQWINSENAPSLQTRQVERAMILESAARYVKTRLGKNSKEYVKVKKDDLSLDDILSAESIDLAMLRIWVEEIRQHIESDELDSESIADRFEKKGFPRRYDDDHLEPLI